jgi:hypothetical protein
VTKSVKIAFYLVLTYGLIGAITDGVACAAISLKSFLSIPIWIPFLPAALAWIAAGMRGIKPEGLIWVGAISLIGGPIIAAKAVAMPMSSAESMAANFSTIRQALAISLVVMLPLCFMCILVGGMLRGAVINRALRLPRSRRL